MKIGHPYWVVKGEQAYCPMEIAGLHDDVGAMPGDDFYSALIFALDFFEKHVREADLAIRFFWPDGTPYTGEPLDREPGPEA